MESITLELRPRLQTCNAFIQLQKSIDSNQVQIKILEKSIILTIGRNEINFTTESVKLIPNSLSALSIMKDWICFRVQTQSESMYGSFKTEVVTNSDLEDTFLKDTLGDKEILKMTDCSILCACCKNVISEKAYFKRILPLPDIDYDLSDWFCCKHDHNDISTNLSPQLSDLFYGPFFSVMHKGLFNNNLKVNGNSIICNRCLQCLGKLRSDSFKIWNCCIDYNFSNGSAAKTATGPLTDFLVAIKTSVNGVIGEEIILQCFVEKETHYLRIKPMDWNLNLMTEPKMISSNNNVIPLESISVVKVLYKYETNKCANDCATAKYCEVGLPVIEAGLKYLLLSTKRFPQLHRVASNYYIGHIHLKETTNKT